jgi:hypothetical protein
MRAGPVDPPRDTTSRPRPESEQQDLQGAIEHARRLEADARRRHGLPGGSAGARGPWVGTGTRTYRDYWTYDRYWYDRPYDNWRDRRDWVDDVGPVDVGPRDPGPRNAGADGGGARRQNDVASRVPDLPPDELLGDEELTPAMRQALDASPEWKQATANLIRAWTLYADAVEAALGDLQDKPEYRRARAELRTAKARLEAVQAAGDAQAAGQGRNARADARPDAPPDRLLSATDAALKARRTVRRLESAALAADPDVQRAERRLDNAVDRRDEVRDKIAAKLPEADRPAAPKRAKLLEEE